MKQKFLLGIFTAFLAVAVLEITLRAAGFVALSLQNFQNKKNFNSRGSYRVLCVGESTTYMGGVDSYPNQLQKILNGAGKNKEFVVINKALPGIGSQYIADNLAQWVNEFQPDIVVAMVGINDHNKLIPLDQETALNDPFAFFKKLRIYKLYRWLALNLIRHKPEPVTGEKPIVSAPAEEMAPATNRTESHPALPADSEKVQEKVKTAPENYQKLYIASLMLEGSGEYAKAEQLFRLLIEMNYDDSITRKLQEKLGNALIAQGKYADLPDVLRIFLGNPHNPTATQWIFKLCREKKGLEGVLPLLNELSAQNPAEPGFRELLGGCYAEVNDSENASAHFRQARNLRINNFNPTTTANYRHIAETLQKNKAKAIFVQYPLRELRTLEEIFPPELKENIIFVDNENSFREGVRKEGFEAYFIDRFAGDFGHGTPKGNALIAQNIAAAILQNFF